MFNRSKREPSCNKAWGKAIMVVQVVEHLPSICKGLVFIGTKFRCDYGDPQHHLSDSGEPTYMHCEECFISFILYFDE